MCVLCLVPQACPTLCDPMDCSTPGFPVLHHLPELAQTDVHWVGDAIQPPHPLSPSSPAAFNLSQHQGLFHWVHCSHQVAKVLEIQLQHQSFQWIMSNSLQPHGLYSPWNSPGQNTGVGSLSLLQLIFPTQELNQDLLHCRWVLNQLSYQGEPSNEYSGLISFSIDWFDLLVVQGTLKSLLQHHSSKVSILWHSAFLMVQLSHPHVTTGKTIAFTDLCWQSNVFAF